MREVSDLYTESEVSHRLVDRAIVELRPADSRLGDAAQADLRDCMRDELFGILAHLHFNEISTQQLDYAAQRIAEMRRWMDCLNCESVDLQR